ncbi:MAG: hypothetical protein Q8P81_02290 [Nanoarchaeota archaeon]|nr:hypothetical protein [Nanoarchaeota archaeon]
MAEFNLKSLVPEIFIDKITLESKAIDEQGSNPHIDSLREPRVFRDPITGKLLREEVRADLMNKSVSSETLTVKINFIMKEKLENDAISSWFDFKNNRELLKYYKVKIIQSMDEEFTNKLLQADSLLELEAPKEVVSRDVEVGKSLVNKSTTDFYVSVRENGIREYDIPFSETFVLKKSNPKHLAYFCVCFLDLDDLMKDYGLDGVSENFRTVQGRVNAELVLKEYDLVSESFLFVDNRNEVWTGQVTQKEEEISGNTVKRWVAGNGKDIKDIKYLELKMLHNTKIQDFRQFKNLERELFDFSVLSNDMLGKSGNFKMPSSNEIVVDINKNKAYFSDMSISRDKDGLTRFLFGVDILEIAKENTLYGKLFRNDNKSLLNQIQIRSMKIKRYRVTNSAIRNELGLAIFDKEEVYSLVALSGEKEPNRFPSVSIQNGTVREIKLDVEDGVRFFTGIDKEMEDVTFGLYQYVVEMEIEDKTIDYLKSKTDQLLNAYETLKEYYNEGMRKGNYDALSDRFSQAFAEQQEKKYENDLMIAPWVKPISSYLEVLSILLESLDYRKYSRILTIYTHPRSGSLEGVSIFLKIIEGLLLKLVSFVEIKSSKSATTAQGNTSPDSSMKTRSTVPVRTIRMEKAFGAIADADVPKKIGYDFLSINEFGKEVNDDGLVVVSKIKYEERTDAETVKYFNGLDVDINLKSNTKQFTVDDKIINNKYMFLTPSVAKINDTIINFLDKGAGLLEHKQYEKFASNAMMFNVLKKSPRSPLIGFIPSTNSNLGKVDQEVKSNNSIMLSSLGVNLISPISLKQNIANFVNTAPLVGSGSLFASEDPLREQVTVNGSRSNSETVSSVNPNSLFTSLLQPEMSKGMNNSSAAVGMNKEFNFVGNDISFFNLNKKVNVLDSINAKKNAIKISNSLQIDQDVINRFKNPRDTKSQMIKDLPNQIKSIMLAGTRPDSVVHNLFSQVNLLSDPKKSLAFKMNYNVINKIEVFDGYDRSESFDGSGNFKTNKRFIRKERWLPLTPERFNQSANKNIFCRMSKYENREFGIHPFLGVEIPLYNEYFIISPLEKIFDGSANRVNDVKVLEIDNSIMGIQKQLTTINKQSLTSLVATKKVVMTTLEPRNTVASRMPTIQPGLLSGLIGKK